MARKLRYLEYEVRPHGRGFIASATFETPIGVGSAGFYNEPGATQEEAKANLEAQIRKYCEQEGYPMPVFDRRRPPADRITWDDRRFGEAPEGFDQGLWDRAEDFVCEEVEQRWREGMGWRYSFEDFDRAVLEVATALRGLEERSKKVPATPKAEAAGL